tara:strand:+ start:227 stop:562 length:336 start_codon:yes stop_codon:yes gene_type:complete
MWVYVFWKSKYISKFKYNNKDELLKVGKDFVEQNIRQGKNIKYQIPIYKRFLDMIYLRKINKQGIRRSDHNLALHSILALIILKKVDLEDDYENGLYFPPKYKKKLCNKNI